METKVFLIKHRTFYRVFRVNFKCLQHFSLIARCFSTAVKCCIGITTISQFFHKIFNTFQALLNLTVIFGVLKIMYKNCNFIVMLIHHLTSFEIHLGLGKSSILTYNEAILYTNLVLLLLLA